MCDTSDDFVSCFACRIHLTPSSLSKPPATLGVKLFAKRNRHDDILLAEVQVQVGGFVTDVDSEGVFVMPKLRPLALTAILVCLIPSASSTLVENPILVFKITISDRFTDKAKVESMRSSLEINSKLIEHSATSAFLSTLAPLFQR
jgi:hypothetical protein